MKTDEEHESRRDGIFSKYSDASVSYLRHSRFIIEMSCYKYLVPMGHADSAGSTAFTKSVSDALQKNFQRRQNRIFGRCQVKGANPIKIILSY